MRTIFLTGVKINLAVILNEKKHKKPVDSNYAIAGGSVINNFIVFCHRQLENLDVPAYTTQAQIKFNF